MSGSRLSHARLQILSAAVNSCLPLTSVLFLLAAKEPGLSMPEYSKKLGEMWRELSNEEKKPYNVSKLSSLCLTVLALAC